MTPERQERVGAVALAAAFLLAFVYNYVEMRPPQLPEPGLRRCDELQLRAAIMDAEACEKKYIAHQVECQAAAVAKNCELVEKAPESMAAW